MKARMLSPVFSCLIVAWPLGRAARCQQMDNFTLLSHLKEADYTAFAVSGNTIFVVQGTDLIALDATDAARPAQLSRRQLNGAATADLVLTNGQYLFARTNTLGLQIYNVSNPRSVSYVGRFAPYDTYQPEVIALDGNRLYFGSSQVLRIFDVTNPSSPNQLANLTYPSRQMSVSQGRAMLSGSTTQPLRVYDLRDPAHPAHLGDLDFRLPYPPNISRTIYHHDTIEMNWPYLISGDTVMYYYWDKFDHWVFYTKYGIHLFTPGTSNSWSRFEYLYDRFYYAGNVFETWDYPITIPPNPLPGFFSDFALTSDKVFANRRYMGDIMIRDLRTMRYVSTIPMQFADLQTAGNRLYGLDSHRMAIYDASASPTVPLRGVFNTPGGTVVALSGNHAYVLGKARSVTTVDISNPTAPRITSKGPVMGNAQAAVVAGQYLYVADAQAGLRVISLADPGLPQEVRIASVAGTARDVAVSGNKAFVAGSMVTLHIFDVTDPTSPVTMGVLKSDQTPWPMARAVCVAGNYAYIVAGTPWSDSGDVGVVDVADPAAPRYIPHGDRGRFLTLDQYGGDVTIADGILYVVGTQGKSRTYDISNAASPVFIGEFPHGRSLEIMDNRWVFLTGGTNYGLEAYLLTDARDVVRVGFVGADVDGVATSNGVVCTASESDGIQLLRFPSLRQPDIVPRGFALTTTTLASGQALGFQGMVVNAGSAATTQSFWVVFAGNPIGVGGPAIALCDSLFVPAGLAPGQSVNLATITRTLYGPADGVVPDNYRVQVIVDERAQVAEIHEDNNTAQAAAELTVLASPNDLRPIEFLFLPESVRGGETITLSGQVEYTGTQTTTRGFWLEFWCSPNADLSPPQYFLCDPLFVGPGVTPGTVYPFLISPTVRTPQQGLPAGSYVVALWVDRSDHIVEKNETNNQLWRPALRLLVGEPLTKARSWELYR